MNKWITRVLLTCCGWGLFPAQGWSVDVSWLAGVQGELQRVSLDPECPNHLLQGVVVEQTSQGAVIVQIEQLNWDLSCGKSLTPQPSKTPEQILAALNESLKSLDLAGMVSRLPLINIDIKQAHFYQHGQAVLEPLRIMGEVSSSQVQVKLSGKQERALLILDKKNKQLTLKAQLSSALLHSPLINLSSDIEIAPEVSLEGRFDDLSQFNLQFSTPVAIKQQVSKGLLRGKGLLNIAHQQLVLTDLTLSAKLKQQVFSVGEFTLALTQPATISLNKIEVVLEMAAKKARWRKNKLPDFRLTSNMRYQPKENKLTAEWVFSSLSQVIAAQLTLANQTLNARLVPGELNLVEANQAGAELKLLATTDFSAGAIKYQAQMDYHLVKQNGHLSFDISTLNVSGTVQDYILENAQLSLEQAYNIERNQLVSVKDNNHLSIDLLDVGVPLSLVNLDFKADINQPEIRDFHAYMLGGELSMKRFKPLALGRSNLTVRGVQLAGLLDYAKLPNARASGLIDANIPLLREADGLHIEDGEIFARAPGGQINIPDSDVVQSLAGVHFGVEFIFRILQDLRFSDLAGKLNYQPDGEMNVEVKIKGLSPHVSKDRPIEFNYSHQENLIQLLRSLRFSNDLERKIEDKYL